MIPADNSFICADNMEVLLELPDGYADCCLTDPPYGIDIGGRGTIGGSGTIGAAVHNYGIKKWDKKIPDYLCFRDMFRSSKNQIIFGGNYFNLSSTNGWIIWDKKCQNGWDDKFSDGEMAWTSYGQKLRIYRHLWTGALRKKSFDEEKRYHPTQKPVALFAWCLTKYTRPGDLIIDPFCGSGTTALACHKTGRRFICIDNDAGYIAIAKQRYSDLLEQGEMFTPAEVVR